MVGEVRDKAISTQVLVEVGVELGNISLIIDLFLRKLCG